MPRAKVPQDAPIWVEVGSQRPETVGFDPFRSFEMLWIVTNGNERRQLLWVCVRTTGIYVAHGMPGDVHHTSYHSDGILHWKVADRIVHSETRSPILDIQKPELIESGTTRITDDTLTRFELRDFTDKPVDRVIYLDNRISEAIYYQVWAIPPFKHGEVWLRTDSPAHVHVITHTVPWIEVVIYEQGRSQSHGA